MLRCTCWRLLRPCAALVLTPTPFPCSPPLPCSELGGVFGDCNLFLGLGRRERKSQALYPWRRMLREMAHHDRQLGQAYCLRGTDPVVVS